MRRFPLLDRKRSAQFITFAEDLQQPQRELRSGVRAIVVRGGMKALHLRFNVPEALSDFFDF
ncbi:MAG TPA: hypothetical protein VK530_01080 [Candidatus Acidoferrum sp.]|nr:hypothetical protein [Candidatus Acidoferrum sp.]